MAGAYYFLDGPNCMVKTSPTMVFGGSSWCPDCPSESKNYNVNSWNQLYPAYKVPVPSHCNPPQPPPQPQPLPNGNSPLPGAPAHAQKPPAGESPSGPITGPQEDPCAPAMSERLGSQDRFGFDTAEHLTMPRTGVFYSVRTGADHVGASDEPGYTGKPLETRPARVKKSGGMITVAEPGSGDGFIVFAPDDINEFGLRGDGVHPDGKWPRKIAQNTLLIMSGAAANGGDDVRNLFAMGMPSARTRGKPVNGFYIEHDPATNIVNFQHTDADGNDDTVAGGYTFDGVAVGLGTGDVTAAANLTDDAAVVGDGGAKGVKTTKLTITADADGAVIQPVAEGTPNALKLIAGASSSSGTGGEWQGYSGDGVGSNQDAGPVVLDSGAPTGAGSGGVITIGTTNAASLTIGRSGVTTTFPGAVRATSPTEGVGYGTGAGGTVTQITSKSTSVTINKVCGRIVTHNETLNAGASVAFEVNNSTVAATDVVVVCEARGGQTGDSYFVTVYGVQAGKFTITLHNYSGSNLGEAVSINFAVIKAVTS